MKKLTKTAGSLLIGAALLAGSSVGLAGLAGASEVTPAQTAAEATNTPAAQLYAALDQLLREHVDLTVAVVQTAVAAGGNLKNAEVQGAIAALGQNTDDLGAAIGAIYGKAAEARFLQLWRAHIGFFVNYTLGVATHNQMEVATAQRDLEGYIAQFAAFMSSATKLPVAALEADLKGHVETLEAAINAIVEKSPNAGAAIEMAARHMDGTAQVLAEGIVSSRGFSGSVTAPAAVLRASLTGMLIQHVADTAFVVQTAVAAGGNLKNAEVQGAIAALGQNTDDLGAAIGAIYGKAAEARFLQLWRAHIGFFVNYTLGVATHNQMEVATAQRDLEGYIAQFAAFMSSATKLPVAALEADLKGHVETLEVAIDDLVAKSPSSGNALAMAENHMAGTAAVLSAGIASSKPSEFGA
jgi:hypothetical protein